MSSIYRGRIPIVDEDNLDTWGKDDITGLPIMTRDMVPVMQYAGSQVVWTGFMTHKDRVDTPQPQLAPARLRADPEPATVIRILNRPTMPPIPTGLEITASTGSTISIQWDSVPVATSYVVAWVNGQTTGKITDIPTTLNPITTYTITGLAPNTYYLVQVATTYPEATSAYSNPVAVTTPS